MTATQLTKPKLVATDVDGTLIDHRELIPARTKRVVAAVVADNVPFVLATGRPPRWIEPVVSELGFAPLCVCGNGAVLYDAAVDRVLTTWALDVDTLAWAAEVAEKVLPGCGLATERIGESAHDAVTPQFVSSPQYVHAWLNPDDTVVAREEVIAQPAIKMLIRLPGATSSEMAATLSPHIAGRADLTYSTEHGLIELSAPGVTKASGLFELGRRLGIEPGDMLAFGDMPNDIPMLSGVGWGVGMGNAHPLVLEVVDEVTGTNVEDGLAQVLERWWTP